MSWLSGITEKAGNLLNKLDQSAAEAFHGEDELTSPQYGQVQSPTMQTIDIGGSSDSQKVVRQSSSSSLTASMSVPANLYKLKQSQGDPSSSFVSTPVKSSPKPASLSATTTSPKTSQKDSDDALFDFLNSNETLGNPKKKTLTPPPSRRRHSRQSSASSTMSNKNGSQSAKNSESVADMLTSSSSPSPQESEVKDSERLVPSESVPDSGTVVDIDMPEEMSVSRSGSNYGNDEGDQSDKQLSSLELENRLLRNEIASLNQEMASVIQRAKDSQQELTKTKLNLEQYNNSASRSDQILRELQAREHDLSEAMSAKDAQLAVLRVRLEEADQGIKVKEQEVSSLRVERERVLKDHTDSTGVHGQALDSLRAKLIETEAALRREQEGYKKAQQEAAERQSKLETEQQTLADALTAAQKKIADEKSKMTEVNSHLRIAKASLDNVRQELSDYKDKAARILQSKERLIASLREGSGASGEAVGVSNLEYDAVKQERDMFREDLQQNKMSLENLRVEVQDLETQLQQDNDTFQEQIKSLEEQSLDERRRREDSDQELLKQKQELQYALEELHRQKGSMQNQISDREKEIEKLRNQLTTRKMGSTTENELESRVRMLTESLIQKQTMLESLSTEKNSLMLQLERLEQQYRDVQASTIRSSSAVVNVHDDDEVVRQRLPGFMREGPTDTEVTRKMKRAANVIDRFSIRLGVFLRRFPIARVFLIVYMVMLHLWVMVVLLTYQPEIHGNVYEHQPMAPHEAVQAPHQGGGPPQPLPPK